MRRACILSQHLAAGSSEDDPSENARRFMQVGAQFIQSIHDLRENGTTPSMTGFEFAALQRRFQRRESPNRFQMRQILEMYLEAGDLGEQKDIPGPWASANTDEDRIEILRERYTPDCAHSEPLPTAHGLMLCAPQLCGKPTGP